MLLRGRYLGDIPLPKLFCNIPTPCYFHFSTICLVALLHSFFLQHIFTFFEAPIILSISFICFKIVSLLPNEKEYQIEWPIIHKMLASNIFTASRNLSIFLPLISQYESRDRELITLASGYCEIRRSRANSFRASYISGIHFLSFSITTLSNNVLFSKLSISSDKNGCLCTNILHIQNSIAYNSGL